MHLELFKNSACKHCLLLLLCKDSCNTTESFLSSTEDSCQQKCLLYLYFYSNNYNLCVNKPHVFAGFLMPSFLSCSHSVNLKHLCVTQTTSRIRNIKKKIWFWLYFSFVVKDRWLEITIIQSIMSCLTLFTEKVNK